MVLLPKVEEEGGGGGERAGATDGRIRPGTARVGGWGVSYRHGFILEIEIYPLQKGLLKDMISRVGCNNHVKDSSYMMMLVWSTRMEVVRAASRGHLHPVGPRLSAQRWVVGTQESRL